MSNNKTDRNALYKALCSNLWLLIAALDRDDQSVVAASMDQCNEVLASSGYAIRITPSREVAKC